MKNLALLAALGIAVSAAPAIAGHHEGMGDKKHSMFEKHDTDGDGMISMDEYMAKAKEKFAKKDTNGDGMISKEEAKEYKEEKREKWKEKREKMKEMKEESASE